MNNIDISDLKAELGNLKRELKQDIFDLRMELKEAKSDLRTEIMGSVTSIREWTLTLWIGQFLLLLEFMVLFLKK